MTQLNVSLTFGVPGFSVTESITRSATGPTVLVGAWAGGAVGGTLEGAGLGGTATNGILEISPVVLLASGRLITQPRVPSSFRTNHQLESALRPMTAADSPAF